MIVLSEDNYKDLIGKQIKVIAVASSKKELEIEKQKEVNVKIIATANKTDEEQVAASSPPEKVDSNQQSTVGYFPSKNICTLVCAKLKLNYFTRAIITRS